VTHFTTQKRLVVGEEEKGEEAKGSGLNGTAACCIRTYVYAALASWRGY
jgi:hypothetical protein